MALALTFNSMNDFALMLQWKKVIPLYSFACKYLVVLNILGFFSVINAMFMKWGRKLGEIREIFFNM